MKNTHGTCATCSQAARTQSYKRIDGFDASFKRSEDFDFAVRHAINGGKFVGIDEPLVTQYMTKNESKNLDIEQLYHEKLLRKHHMFIHKHYSLNFCLRWNRAKYFWFKRKYIHMLYFLVCILISNLLIFLNRFLRAFKNYKVNRMLNNFYNNS